MSFLRVGFCSRCCAPFTLLSSVLLLLFALLLDGNSDTFVVVAAKQEWDLREKAAICYRGAAAYLGISVLLWVWVLVPRGPDGKPTLQRVPPPRSPVVRQAINREDSATTLGDQSSAALLAHRH